ncbi:MULTISPECIES: hypothetical protein [unclassified Chryseobacterium]|uniref:hypothetical protein n=1 Tax=unclassified Chryseobacterium TaxID=2593645 RepID=UPI000F4561F3|nr:hypothetical protein [Chryseobacterium sp. G0240]ROI00994.1 hypothetical protein EGI16_19040 [Chryseobacterium sp. G0240]
MKYLKYIILIAFLIVIIIYYNKSANVEMKQSADYLHNNVEFEGYVTGFEQSNNHAFGIIHVKLTKANTPEFNKTLERGIYPYKIKGDIAELYCTVSVERKKGDVIKLISNTQTVYYNPQNSKEEGSIFVVTDPYNIDFVKKNTLFK